MSGLFGSIFNTSTNHIVHHENRKGNYGIYFNIWDRPWLQTCLIMKKVLFKSPQIPNQKAKQIRPLCLIRNND